MDRYGIICTLTVLVLALNNAAGYKHIIFMHGIFSGPSEIIEIQEWLKTDHPGTNITAINLFDNIRSLLTPMWVQVDKISLKVQQIMKENHDGVHLLCFSQGGLICRGLLSTLNHNVDTFISLSSPLMGQYGDSVYLKYFFPTFLKSEAYKFFYSNAGQKFSIANYWNDPHHQTQYKKYSNYLAILNNQTFNPKSHEFKKNFMKLKTLVLIGGPNDGVITPWQSSQFGFYDKNETVKEMRNEPWYLDDCFGLKTLDSRKAIHTHTVPGVEHIHWYNTKPVYEKYILPYLI